MKTRSITRWVWILALLIAGLACNIPFMSTPTPFVFPTPDATMTAMFAPTETASPAPTETASPEPTETFTPQPSDTPIPPTETEEPTATETDIPAPPPGRDRRDGPRIVAEYVSDEPAIDGSTSGWEGDFYPVEDVVYGKSHWKGDDDLSAEVKVMWDYDNLYVAWKVTDDKYVQFSKGANLYEGDSVEILVDTAVQYDYWNNWLDWDDYQIGINPGRDEPGENMEAYLWFPKAVEGKLKNVEIGSKVTDGGYRVTAAIPWSYLDVDPYDGMHLGFAASVSDDDSKDGGEQQTMVSSTWRALTDPTSWGDLVLVK